MASAYTGNIAQQLLINPISKGADRLCILSHVATPSMASWLLKTYEEQELEGISVELIVTFGEDQAIPSVLENNHNGFKELQKAFRQGPGTVNSFSCSYNTGRAIPKRNSYIWLCGETPVKAFSCSYDFTQQSILRNRSGSITDSNPISAYSRFEKAVDDSIYCDNSEVEEYVVITETPMPAMADLPENDKNLIKLPLVTERTGEPGTKSGLNWGQRARRNPNEAYIPLPRKIALSGFFPLNKQHFLVVTDDHHVLQLRVEQQNDKAITTPASNAQLGEYFRNRLGLANGTQVTKADLEAYGRSDVSFYKIDDEQYYMDFSVAGGRRRRNG